MQREDGSAKPPSGRLRRWGIVIVWIVISTLVSMSSWHASSAWAQDPPPDAPSEPTPGPSIEERVAELAGAFGRVGDLAGSAQGDAGWQAADAAFNTALDTMDVHRAPLVDALGAPAAEAFAAVDAELASLVAGLDATDPVGVRVSVGRIQDRLDDLAPSVVSAGPRAAEIAIVLDWAASVERAIALRDQARWRDMRNEAIDLIADIEARGGRVGAVSPAAADAVARARVFAYRLRSAALDQSAEEGSSAARILNRALDDLLVVLGAESAPTATPQVDARTRLRGYQVRASAGDRVQVPIVAENLPQIGLGALDMAVRWSPRSLDLTDAEWLEGQGGRFERGDESGRIRLSLPQAPVGPSGDAILVSLQFDVSGDAPDARELLPDEDLQVLDDAIPEAVRFIRLADRPKAAVELARAYYQLADGRDEPGSAYDELQRFGLAQPLASELLTALELATVEEVETDEVVVAIARLRRRWVDSLAAYLVGIAPDGNIPVMLTVFEITDTQGRPIPIEPPIHGQVILDDAVEFPTAALTASVGEDSDPRAGDGTATSALVTPPPVTTLAGSTDAPPEVAGTESGMSGPAPTSVGPGTGQDPVDPDAAGADADAPPDADGQTPFPRSLLAALVLASGIGAVATFLSMRED